MPDRLTSAEKSLYAELLATIAFIAVFLYFAMQKYSGPHLLSRPLIASSIGYFGLSLFLNRKSRFKSGDYVTDERDRQIENTGIRSENTVFVFGITAILVRFWDEPPLTPDRIFKLLIVVLIAASAARIVQQLRLYYSSH